MAEIGGDKKKLGQATKDAIYDLIALKNQFTIIYSSGK